jgi:hypothetical protein
LLIVEVMRDTGHELAQCIQLFGLMQILRQPNPFLFRLLLGAKILKAVNSPDELAVLVEQGRNVDENRNSRAVGPLDNHFLVSGRLAGPKNVFHGRIAMGQKSSIRPLQPVRATVFLVGVAGHGLAPP